jgi:hypothetical protein
VVSGAGGAGVFDALVVAASANQPGAIGGALGVFLAQGENFTARGNTFVGYKVGRCRLTLSNPH